MTHSPAGRAHLPYTVTLTAPMHHGAGTSGNTALLRTQRFTGPDGQVRSVPFVSGNSVRHRLREALAWHLVTTLGLGEGSLTKAQVDLLWSGGALTRTGDSRLAVTRQVEQLLPHLSLLGYSAGSEIVGGVLAMNMLHLVCSENTWRLPPVLAATAHAQRPAVTYRGEDFGTRHDVTGTPVDRLVALTGEEPTTTQMIYDWQVVTAGALMAGSLDLTAAATATQHACLLVALDLAMPLTPTGRTISLGAKSGTGYGTGTVVMPHLDTDLGDAHDWFTTHHRDRRSEILELLAEVVR